MEEIIAGHLRIWIKGFLRLFCVLFMLCVIGAVCSRLNESSLPVWLVSIKNKMVDMSPVILFVGTAHIMLSSIRYLWENALFSETSDITKMWFASVMIVEFVIAIGLVYMAIMMIGSVLLV